MNDNSPDRRPGRMLLALAVHLYTASGMILALAGAMAIVDEDYRRAFLAMLAAVFVDATDGTLARRAEVRRHAPRIDGRKLDDIVDYVNYVLLPILLIWRGGWLPASGVWVCAVPLVASLFGFAHTGAKEEDRGFFRGFPSYWNVVAFYVAVGTTGPSWWTAAALLGLSALTVSPVRFVYPNRPPQWRGFFLGGATAWGLVLLAMVVQFPDVSPFWLALSLPYPLLYVLLSLWLDWRDRSTSGRSEGG